MRRFAKFGLVTLLVLCFASMAFAVPDFKLQIFPWLTTERDLCFEVGPEKLPTLNVTECHNSLGLDGHTLTSKTQGGDYQFPITFCPPPGPWIDKYEWCSNRHPIIYLNVKALTTIDWTFTQMIEFVTAVVIQYRVENGD